MPNSSTIPVPEVWRRLNQSLRVDADVPQQHPGPSGAAPAPLPRIIDADIPGLRHGGAWEEAEHRRLLGRGTNELAGVVLGTRRTASACSADTAVSSPSFVAVTGMQQAFTAPFHGEVDIEGRLYVEETTPGQLQVRIVQDPSGTATVLWGPVTLGFQGSELLANPQLATFLVPIGGENLLAAVGETSYTIDVEIAAPSGSYKVLTGTGKESGLRSLLWPTLGV